MVASAGAVMASAAARAAGSASDNVLLALSISERAVLSAVCSPGVTWSLAAMAATQSAYFWA